MGRALVAAVSTALIAGLTSTGCGSDNNLHGMSAPNGPVYCGGKSALTAEGSTAQQNAGTLGKAAKHPFTSTGANGARWQGERGLGLDGSCGDNLTRTGIGWIWRRHGVPINQMLLAKGQSI